MKKIDCLGEICPIPVMNLQKQLPALKNGESVLIVTDHSCTLTSLKQFCRTHHLFYSIDEVLNGVWEITISPLTNSLR